MTSARLRLSRLLLESASMHDRSLCIGNYGELASCKGERRTQERESTQEGRRCDG
jgi:hypothetical protein